MAEQRQDREALRRRLYRPDASPDDLQRFASAAPRTARRAGASATPTPRRRRPRPSRRAVGAAGVAAVLLVVAGALLLRPTGAPPAPAPTGVALSAEDRSELLQNLARGGDAGIAAYLVTHPSPPGLVATDGTITDELHGSGPGTLPLDVSQVPAGAGRATVLVVVAQPVHVAWQALRLGTDGSPVVVLRPVAERQGDQAAGALTTATFAHSDGGRPVRLRVDVPDGVRWGAAVVFTR